MHLNYLTKLLLLTLRLVLIGLLTALILQQDLLSLLPFFLFLDVFNWIFPENKLSLMGAIALVFLLGAEVFKNDCDMYRGALQDSWQGFAAKWQLEKESGDRTSCSCFSGSFFRPAKT